MTHRANINFDSFGDNLAKQLPNGERLDRFHYPHQQFPPQNPFDSSGAGSYPQHHQPLSHRLNDRFGASHMTYHRDIHSEPIRRSHSKSKHSSLATSALALLAFLFFINILQNCLKEQMVSMNPTVMIMSANRGNIRKTGLIPNKVDTIKELDNIPFESQLDESNTREPVADNIDIPTDGTPEYIEYDADITAASHHNDASAKK